MKSLFLIFFFPLAAFFAGNMPDSAAINNQGVILFHDSLEMKQDDWIAEFEKPASSRISVIDKKLDLEASAGATLWFKHRLSGNVMITYNVTVIDSGGSNDRVSDLNAFWMAEDSASEKLRPRNGKFTSYDNMSLYYAGVGGNENTTTRFRKYHYDGSKPVIAEYLDKPHLLEGNKTYSIKIIVKDGQTSLCRNGCLFFEYTDKNPLQTGYFGFRTTRSHQRFDSFKVTRIQ